MCQHRNILPGSIWQQTITTDEEGGDLLVLLLDLQLFHAAQPAAATPAAPAASHGLAPQSLVEQVCTALGV